MGIIMLERVSRTLITDRVGVRMLSNLNADLAESMVRFGLGTERNPFPIQTMYDATEGTDEVALGEKPLIQVRIPDRREVGYLDPQGVLHLVEEIEGDSSAFHHRREAGVHEYMEPRTMTALDQAIQAAGQPQEVESE